MILITEVKKQGQTEMYSTNIDVRLSFCKRNFLALTSTLKMKM
jgi:hypothetical protein